MPSPRAPGENCVGAYPDYATGVAHAAFLPYTNRTRTLFAWTSCARDAKIFVFNADDRPQRNHSTFL
jgi:hypothetical protein